MGRNRLRRILAAIFLLIALSCASASAAPTSPLCDQAAYKRAHPLICDASPGGAGPAGLPGAGGEAPGDGGLIGAIRRVLGGLSGGLL